MNKLIEKRTALLKECETLAMHAKESGEALSNEDRAKIAANFSEADALLETIGDARGAPARIFKSREAADEIAAERAQAQQAAMAMQTAQAGAGVMKDMAAAGAAMPEGAA